MPSVREDSSTKKTTAPKHLETKELRLETREMEEHKRCLNTIKAVFCPVRVECALQAQELVPEFMTLLYSF
jgi:hypothetical protein